MTDLGWILQEVPNQLFVALGSASGLALVAGPLALLVLAFRRRAGGLRAIDARRPSAILFSLLSITVAIVTGTASLVFRFNSQAPPGGGRGLALDGAVAAAQPVLYGVVTVVICLLLVAALTLWRSRGPSQPIAGEPRMPLGLAIVWSLLLGLAILVVDQLLRVHHTLLAAIFAFASPLSGRTASTTFGSAANDSSFLILASVLTTATLLVAGVLAWRTSRGRRLHPLLTWSSAIGLAVVVAGSVWHASIAGGTIETYRDVIRRAGESAASRP